MNAADVIGLVLMGAGVILAIIASIGVQRFRDVLMRMHAASKTQLLGLLLILAGAALIAGSWPVAGMLLVVVLVQMVTVTISSTMVGRAAFRRGFVSGLHYAVDDLTPRLAEDMDEDLDDDGFVDELDSGTGRDEDSAVPTNVVSHRHGDSDLTMRSAWDEPEHESEEVDVTVDIDLEDETEAELEPLLESLRQNRR